MPSSARCIIRGGVKQPDRRPSQIRNIVLGDVEQMNLLERLRRKTFGEVERLWVMRARHQANLGYGESLARQGETRIECLPQVQTPPTLSANEPAACPPAHQPPQPARTFEGAVACPSLARRPRAEQDDVLSAPQSVQTPNIPQTQPPLTLEERLERLAAMPVEDDLSITWEQYTEQQAQQDAQEQGFGPQRPVTPRLGPRITEPVQRGWLLTPQFYREMGQKHPWTQNVPIRVLARAGGTQTSVMAAVHNIERGRAKGMRLGPGAFVSCVKQMAQHRWGLPAEMHAPLKRYAGG